ncbi:MAG: hypothetical protein CMI12_07455 [Oceanospirillum sp.]|nr:hypothetical protein [Oceanospirillum sp.]
MFKLSSFLMMGQYPLRPLAREDLMIAGRCLAALSGLQQLTWFGIKLTGTLREVRIWWYRQYYQSRTTNPDRMIVVKSKKLLVMVLTFKC